MRAFFLIALYLVALLPQAWASGVAVFDYDDRPDREQTTAQYIARQLREKIPAIGVDQYSGKNDTETSIRVLRELDAKGYDLIITITSDALIVAHHTIQQTPTLFTNVNNPLFLGFNSLGPPKGINIRCFLLYQCRKATRPIHGHFAQSQTNGLYF